MTATFAASTRHAIIAPHRSHRARPSPAGRRPLLTRATTSIESDDASPSESCSDRDLVSGPPGTRRRDALIAASTVIASAFLNPASIATASSTRADVTVFVSNDGRSPDGSNTKAYASIADAIAAAVDAAAALGKVDVACVRIAPGTYAERVVVQPFAASCGALVIESMDGKSESVTLEHFTSTPYEATLEAAPGCTGLAVHNLTIRHGSKSVANNYAVFAQGGSSLTLTGCDVKSETGSGVAGEGASISLEECVVHDCRTHGIAVYGDLLGESGFGRVLKCRVYGNGEDGVLVRGGASADVTKCEVVDNGKFGVELSDVGPGTRIVDNVMGPGKKGKKAVAADDAIAFDVEISDNRQP